MKRNVFLRAWGHEQLNENAYVDQMMHLRMQAVLSYERTYITLVFRDTTRN